MSAVVEFLDVDFAYARRGRGAGFAIRGLSFSVDAGEVFGVIGPNASGKTTLIRLLSGVVAPVRGDVRLGGESVARLSRASIATRVAVVPQDLPPGLPYSVEEMVLMGRFAHGPGRFFESDEDRRHARDAMTATGVWTLRDAAVDDLSGGERQRVMLARALCQHAPLLVLDEPTAHLDLRHQAECAGLLRRFNRAARLTIVLVSHDLNLAAELCDRLLLLEAGVPAAIGSVDAVMEEATLSSVYGCRVIVDKHPVSRRPAVQIVWPDADGR